MSKVFAGIAQVNGIAASVLAVIPGGQPFAAAAAASASLYGGLARLTAKPPAPPSKLEDVTIGAEQPTAYAVGRCELTGQLVHTEAHGRDREDVPNPWRTDTICLTLGPVVAIDQLYVNKNAVNFDPSTGWETSNYGKYLRADTRLGLTPETTAVNWTDLDPGSPPSFNLWSGSHLVSGRAMMQFGMLLDSEETHFRSGAPDFSAVGRWNKGYDPRLDDTYAGGLGAHRLGNEATYEYSVNGVIHALTYLYGRYQNGTLVIGGGCPITSFDVDSFVQAANIADANSWTCHGVVYENGEDGEIWNNANLMLETAAAWLTNDGGVLRVLQRRPLVAVDTIRSEDLEGPYSLKPISEFKDGINTIVPTIMSESNLWSYVPIDKVTVPTLVTSQGEERSKAHKFTLVTDPNQAAALSVLMIYDSVEIDPIQLTLGRRFLSYDVGTAFDTDIPELGLVGITVVLLRKEIELKTGRVIAGLKTDTTAKHAFALGQTNQAPPQPALASNAELELAANDLTRSPLKSSAITNSYTSGFASAITATEEGDATWTITVPTHNRVYANPLDFPTVSIDADTITGLAAETTYRIYYDDPVLKGGPVVMQATTNSAESVVSQTNPFRHYVSVISTAAAGQPADDGQPASPPNTSGPDGDWDGTGSIP